MNYKITRASRENLADDLTGLAELRVKQLKERWELLYGTKPPPRISRDLLTRAVAYRMQEKVLGGLRSSTRRLLERIAEDLTTRRVPRVSRVGQPHAGTVLIREWGGTSHRVRVTEEGVIYGGKRYRSLSEVARAITGARWSGPLFFGLRGRRKESGHDAC